ncbi:CLUMA_CG018431, isoform A [Clunio marinus]|uniref:CLUMA_CG018431, isoform A n=1 Tax=Clunio marinus TaxID=568069 RepID=A0A1J1IZ96_9DIPT|nr:CLUMA_CG018431, isoform A [Clunio marinus]
MQLKCSRINLQYSLERRLQTFSQALSVGDLIYLSSHIQVHEPAVFFNYLKLKDYGTHCKTQAAQEDL